MIKTKVQKAAKAILPHVLVTIFGIVTSAGVFLGGLWAGTAIAGAFFVGLAHVLSGQKPWWPTREALVATSLFLIAAWLSCLQATYPDVALHGALKITTILIPLSLFFLPLNEKALISVRDKTPFYLMMAVVCMVAMSAVVVFLTVTDPFSPYITKFNRGFSYFAILVWPLWAIMFHSFEGARRRGARHLVWVSLAILLLAAFVNHSKTTSLGLVCAFITFGVAYWRPRCVWFFVPLVTLVLVLMPLWIGWGFPLVHAPADGALSSAWHRLEIWDYLHYYFVKDFAFLHGWGIANTSFLPVAGPHADLYRYAIDSAAHPHNAAIQVWGETGLPGLLASLYLIYWVLSGISRLPSKAKPFAWAAYVMALILVMSAYNFWTDSLWAVFALTSFSFDMLTKEKTGN